MSGGPRSGSRFRIAATTAPHVRALFRIMKQERMKIVDLAKRTGLNMHTIYEWNRGVSGGKSKSYVAKYENIRAALNALGYELLIVPQTWLGPGQYTAINTEALREMLRRAEEGEREGSLIAQRLNAMIREEEKQRIEPDIGY